ncbi:e3 ubiquitin-protein [Cyclospora cayetanensis]|uniref:E3 ubiquitin-protein n=1 Tax=Cyclospora cayetanensis TaxID=88456 RepID=A0A1D3D3A7_9EIME|nr:e3 ubiquitin-protein [Cyclospora cayetanensis]
METSTQIYISEEKGSIEEAALCLQLRGPMGTAASTQGASPNSSGRQHQQLQQIRQLMQQPQPHQHGQDMSAGVSPSRTRTVGGVSGNNAAPARGAPLSNEAAAHVEPTIDAVETASGIAPSAAAPQEATTYATAPTRPAPTAAGEERIEAEDTFPLETPDDRHISLVARFIAEGLLSPQETFEELRASFLLIEFESDQEEELLGSDVEVCLRLGEARRQQQWLLQLLARDADALKHVLQTREDWERLAGTS